VSDFELLDVSGGTGVIPKATSTGSNCGLRPNTRGALLPGRAATRSSTSAPPTQSRRKSTSARMRRMPPVAAKLGADQSLVGGVTQVTRTDYNVTYTLGLSKHPVFSTNHVEQPHARLESQCGHHVRNIGPKNNSGGLFISDNLQR
jgi:hypothetical protein